MKTSSDRPLVPSSTSAWLIPFLIAGIIILAHSPVLFPTYLRQDDWSAATWNIHLVFSHVDLRKYAVDEMRPLSIPFILFSDAISHHMDIAWIARLINIVLIAAAAILTYRWQMTLEAEEIFAACFAACSFLTQAAQLISSTANYMVMIVSVIVAQTACFTLYRGFLDAKHRTRWYAVGATLLFLSLFSYPLGCTYVFLFLLIYYLREVREQWWRQSSFVFQAGLMTLVSMASIVIIGKLTYLALGYTPSNPDRSITIDWNLPNKLDHWWRMLEESLNIDAWNAMIHYYVSRSTFPTGQIVPLAAALFTMGIVCQARKAEGQSIPRRTVVRRIAVVICTFLILLTLAYAPVLAPHFYDVISFRYTLVVTPMTMYALFWSGREIASGQGWNGGGFSKGLCVVTLLLAMVCAHHLSRYVVAVPETELRFMTASVERKALPELAAGRPVALYLVMNEHQHLSIDPSGFNYAEYGMTMSGWSPGWLFAGAIHVMRTLGYESIETEPPYQILEWDNEQVRCKVKWGYIYTVRNNQPPLAVPAGMKKVVIDMNDVELNW